MATKVLTLIDGGKSITVEAASGNRVAFIVWRKNGGVALPLALSHNEAKQLRSMLDAVLENSK